MEERLSRLLELLNKYSVREINKIYRDKEVELEIESFTKHPDVRWSESLKKRMIQSAKRKRIAPGRQAYLENQIEELNNYNKKEHVDQASEDLFKLFNLLQETTIQYSQIELIQIEFPLFNHRAQIHLYGKFDSKWYENELGEFTSDFESAKYWKELDTGKFSSMSDQLEIIDIENEEYPQIFVQIRELRVFQAVKLGINESKIKSMIKEIMPNTKIEIGIHDSTFYTVIENK